MPRISLKIASIDNALKELTIIRRKLMKAKAQALKAKKKGVQIGGAWYDFFTNTYNKIKDVSSEIGNKVKNFVKPIRETVDKVVDSGVIPGITGQTKEEIKGVTGILKNWGMGKKKVGRPRKTKTVQKKGGMLRIAGQGKGGMLRIPGQGEPSNVVYVVKKKK